MYRTYLMARYTVFLPMVRRFLPTITPRPSSVAKFSSVSLRPSHSLSKSLAGNMRPITLAALAGVALQAQGSLSSLLTSLAGNMRPSNMARLSSLALQAEASDFSNLVGSLPRHIPDDELDDGLTEDQIKEIYSYQGPKCFAPKIKRGETGDVTIEHHESMAPKKEKTDDAIIEDHEPMAPEKAKAEDIVDRFESESFGVYSYGPDGSVYRLKPEEVSEASLEDPMVFDPSDSKYRRIVESSSQAETQTIDPPKPTDLEEPKYIDIFEEGIPQLSQAGSGNNGGDGGDNGNDDDEERWTVTIMSLSKSEG